MAKEVDEANNTDEELYEVQEYTPNIIIVYGFSGEYTTEINDNGDTNIPHETINFFKADDGHFYWYVTPYGEINNAKGSGPFFTDEGTVLLFVHNLCNGDGLEVVASAVIAENLEAQGEGGIWKRENKPKKAYLYSKSSYESAVETTEGDKRLTYGGRSLSDIFSGNRGNLDDPAYITCRVKDVKKPSALYRLVPSYSELDQDEMQDDTQGDAGSIFIPYIREEGDNDLWVRSLPRYLSPACRQYEALYKAYSEDIDWIAVDTAADAGNNDSCAQSSEIELFERIPQISAQALGGQAFTEGHVSLWEMFGRRDYEPAYSAAICYLLKEDRTFRRLFVSDFLGEEDPGLKEAFSHHDEASFKVLSEVKMNSNRLREILGSELAKPYREKSDEEIYREMKEDPDSEKRMDILISFVCAEGRTHVVVIENKIKAPLHVIETEELGGELQIGAYSRWFEKYYSDLARPSGFGPDASSRLHRFLLHPNSNALVSTEEDREEIEGLGFRSVTYGSLQEKIEGSSVDSPESASYDYRVMQEFREAIRWHGPEWYLLQQQEMVSRFIRKLYELTFENI